MSFRTGISFSVHVLLVLCLLSVCAVADIQQDGSSVELLGRTDHTQLLADAHRHNVDAQLKLGLLYFYGHNDVKQNYTEAAHWLEKASSHHVAQLKLGQLWYEGYIHELGDDTRSNNCKFAHQWFHRALAHETTEAEAQYWLGQMRYDKTQTCFEDYDRHQTAIDFWERAKQKGYVHAFYSLAEAYLAVGNVPQAKLNFELAVEKNHLPSQVRVAMFHQHGQHGFELNITKAIALFNQTQQDPRSRKQLAILLFEGKHLRQDFKKARHLLRDDADHQQDREAQYYMGMMYHDGHHIKHNMTKAHAYLRKSANQGFARAQYQLGLDYLQGLLSADSGLDSDSENIAKDWFTQAAAANGSLPLPEAQTQLGLLYLYGKHTPRDEEVAMRLLEEASHTSHCDQVIALRELGLLYKEKKPFDWIEKARVLFERAAHLNDTQSAFESAKLAKESLAFNSSLNSSIAYERQIYWLTIAADRDHDEAQYELALILLEQSINTNTEQQTITKAIDWLEKSAKHGNKHATAKLGELYHFGFRHIDINITKALSLYNQTLDHPLSQYGLGRLYYEGDPTTVAQSYKEAFDFFSKSASQNVKESLYYLGLMYKTGQHVEKNCTTAFEYFTHSTKQGYAQAAYELGMYYDFDDGICKLKRNVSLAIQHFTTAVTLGSYDAHPRLTTYYLKGHIARNNSETTYRYAIDLLKTALKHEVASAYTGLGTELVYCVRNHHCLRHFSELEDIKKQGIEYLHIAASRGETEAKYQLALLERDNNIVACVERLTELVKGTDGQIVINAAYWLGRIYQRVSNYTQLQPPYLGSPSSDNATMNAIHWLNIAADGLRGIDKAAIALGQIYEHANRMNKAVEWYTDAMNNGYTDGYVQLGRLYYHGKGVVQNYTRAAHLFLKAVESVDSTGRNEKASRHAHNYLGLFYKNGHYFQENPAQAFAHFQLAVASVPQAQYEVGQAYRYGSGTKKDIGKAKINLCQTSGNFIPTFVACGELLEEEKLYTEAKEHYEKARADKYLASYQSTVAAAHRNLGKMHYKGRFFNQSNEKAFEHFQRASDYGDAEAQYLLAEFYYNATSPIVEPQYERAFDLFNSSAHQQFVPAYFMIGKMHYQIFNGTISVINRTADDESDLTIAVYYTELAADKNYGPAFALLVDIFVDNFDKLLQSASAERCERCKKHILASKNNDLRARRVLGYMFYHGTCFEQSYDSAAMHLKRAAFKGDAIGQYLYGMMFHKSHGLATVQNYTTSHYWLSQSAAQNYALAEYQLGVDYLNGVGFTQSVERAFDYLIEASQHRISHPHLCEVHYMIGRLQEIGVPNVTRSYDHIYSNYSQANNERLGCSQADALIRTGLLYLDHKIGDPAEDTLAKAEDLFLTAAGMARTNFRAAAEASYHLAMMHLNAHTALPNYTTAHDRLQTALELSNQHHLLSTIRMGDLYKYGLVVRQDVSQARVYYESALVAASRILDSADSEYFHIVDARLAKAEAHYQQGLILLQSPPVDVSAVIDAFEQSHNLSYAPATSILALIALDQNKLLFEHTAEVTYQRLQASGLELLEEAQLKNDTMAFAISSVLAYANQSYEEAFTYALMVNDSYISPFDTLDSDCHFVRALAELHHSTALLLEKEPALAPQSAHSARFHILQAARYGHPVASYKAAQMYVKGTDAATHYLIKSATKEYTDAEFELGLVYKRTAGRHGLTQSHRLQASTHFLYRAAVKSHREAQLYYAHALYYGQGVSQDYTAAKAWYEKAAAQGSAQALYCIARIYERGQGVDVDLISAAALYKQAINIDAQHVRAQVALAHLYETGKGVPQKLSYALSTYRSLNLINVIPAKYRLGLVFLHGVGVEQSTSQALLYLEEAASLGSWKAQTQVCDYYFYYRNSANALKDQAKTERFCQQALATAIAKSKNDQAEDLSHRIATIQTLVQP